MSLAVQTSNVDICSRALVLLGLKPIDNTLRMNTAWAAYSVFEDHEKGTIAPGKLGDFAVLSQDPGTLAGSGLLQMGVDATILGGEVVFEA